MRNLKEITLEETVVMMSKCWMTHDGMWFFNCLQEFGIEKANKLNKASIAFLAPFEIERMKKLFGIEGDLKGRYEEFKTFFTYVSKLFIPDYMGGSFELTDDHYLEMEMRPGECFAYKGIKRIGVLDDYECGVFYRIECWLRNLGLTFDSDTNEQHCLFHKNGSCHKRLKFNCF